MKMPNKNGKNSSQIYLNLKSVLNHPKITTFRYLIFEQLLLMQVHAKTMSVSYKVFLEIIFGLQVKSSM